MSLWLTGWGEQVFQESVEDKRDACTLNPAWNHTVSVPLALPLLADMACCGQVTSAAAALAESSPHSLPRDRTDPSSQAADGCDAAYELICHELQTSTYSMGVLKIEVVDGYGFAFVLVFAMLRSSPD